ncbi:Putative transcriptional regulator, PAS and GerEdomains [Sodalis praecaptivus]|uniref:Putative transcriptional regulator, PAS and GerEdomains n=1 Tax=Sodalis praecaptivus TaxID=1239307 RepID=W0HZD0_9GAMM|nr:PAS and helix-turn-helix domain-containing protein [Sodalis praecaptivus]AHF77877.1 Putative transcriptional regulator, PAS and GerEdomains [Sodalis praecaptivus]
MEKKPKISNKPLMLESLNNITVLSLIEHSALPWGIKDTNSRHVYMNDACKDFLDIPEKFNYEGRTDKEFPCLWAPLEPEFTAQDRKSELSPNGTEIISTTYYGRDHELAPYYSPKFPIKNCAGEILGTIYYAKRFSYISIQDFFSSLKPSVLTFNSPVDIFTERELEIIFYAIQKIPAKEIAPILCISHRTVENRLLKIYEKVGTNSIKGLIEYCHNVGLNNYVPKKLLREGVNFCW